MLCFRSQQVARNCFCKMCFYDNMNVRFCLWLFYVCLEELELLHRESCSVRCLEFVMFTKCNKPMVLNPKFQGSFYTEMYQFIINFIMLYPQHRSPLKVFGAGLESKLLQVLTLSNLHECCIWSYLRTKGTWILKPKISLEDVQVFK